jgi:hypothetical protein
MKRFAVLFAAGVFLIPAAGCEGTPDGPTVTSPAATTTTPPPTSAPAGKASADSGRRAQAAQATANPNGPKNDH